MMSDGETFHRDKETVDREKLKNYLMSIFNVFSSNVPQIIIPKESIIDFTNGLTDEQIQRALKISGTLDDIIINLIRKFTKEKGEPLWSIQSYGEKQYFVPSDEAIDKYNLQSKGEDGYFLNSNFEIQPPLRGGKKSKRRRTRSKSRTKRRVKRRVKSTFRKS
jgi:hypothetical protein